MKTVARFMNDESGATAIEYGLIAALISVGIIAAATTLGNGLVGPVQRHRQQARQPDQHDLIVRSLSTSTQGGRQAPLFFWVS